MKLKPLLFAMLSAMALSACNDDANDKMLADQDSQVIDNEVKTPQQNTYTASDECKKDFPDEGDCVEKIIVVDGHQQSSWIGPYFFLWGALLHNNGMYSYGYNVPQPRVGVARIASSLPANRPAPNYSNAKSYTSSRTSSLSASRGGFGGTARGASSSSSSSSGGG